MLRKYKVCDNRIVMSNDSDCSIQVYINPEIEERRYLVDELKIDEHTLNSRIRP